MIDTLIVIAKCPVPGHVKTRMVPPLDFEQAASVAAAALTDTLATAATVPARQRVLLMDGAPGSWAPVGWRVIPQVGGGLDRRLVAGLLAVGPGPALVIGMDTPQLRSEQLAQFDPSGYDACLGLAFDGGFWAIGLREPQRSAEAIEAIPMSTPTTGREQYERLVALGMRVQLLAELRDVDTYADATAVAALIPESPFAAVVAGIGRDLFAAMAD